MHRLCSFSRPLRTVLCLLSSVFCPHTNDERQTMEDEQEVAIVSIQTARPHTRTGRLGRAVSMKPPPVGSRVPRDRPHYFCFLRRPRMPAPTRSRMPLVGSGVPSPPPPAPSAYVVEPIKLLPPMFRPVVKLADIPEV